MSPASVRITDDRLEKERDRRQEAAQVPLSLSAVANALVKERLDQIEKEGKNT